MAITRAPTRCDGQRAGETFNVYRHLSLIAIVLIAGCGGGADPAEALDPCDTSGMALNVNFEGVWTNPNPHSKVPAGAARRAENVINPRPGIAECVPGQETLAGSYTASDERLAVGISYDGVLVESTSGATPRLYVRDTSGPSLTDKGAYSPPSGVVRMPMAIAGDRLYAATSVGLRALDSAAATVETVDIPEPLAVEMVGVGLGTLFSGAGESVAYRAVVSRLMADGSYRRSKPSGRAVYTAVATESVLVGVWLRAGMEATDRIEIYRTGIAASGVDPGDVMYMVAQFAPDAGIVAGTASYQEHDDNAPDALRGEALYTNSTMEGISRQNEDPPLAKQVEVFDDFLVLANVQGRQRYIVRFIGLPDEGDQLTIAGVAYTARAAPNASINEYKLNTSGTTAQAIAATAQNLVYLLNDWPGRSPARTVHAYYLSGANDPPGIVMIEALTVSGAAFTLQASANGERFEPELTSAQSSAATTEPNGIWLSKRGQHWAFPPLRSTSATYRFRVGNSGRAILRMIALREALIVFVDGEGVWKVKRTGAESWRVDPINTKAHLLVPDSVAVVDNQVIALTTRGVVAIDEGGVEEIDLPIKDQIAAIMALGTGVTLPYTFAVGDDARLRYILYHPLTSGSTTSGHAWVYNADNDTWTERTDAASGGFVGADDGLLYLGSALTNTLTRERTGDETQLYKRPDNTAIPFRLEWTVMDEEDPGSEKQFTELRLMFENAINGDVTFNCTNDLGGQESTTGSTSDSEDGEPFVRVWVPDGCQRTTRLKVDIQRGVLEQAFSVVGMKTLLAGMYDGGMTR